MRDQRQWVWRKPETRCEDDLTLTLTRSGFLLSWHREGDWVFSTSFNQFFVGFGIIGFCGSNSIKGILPQCTAVMWHSIGEFVCVVWRLEFCSGTWCMATGNAMGVGHTIASWGCGFVFTHSVWLNNCTGPFPPTDPSSVSSRAPAPSPPLPSWTPRHPTPPGAPPTMCTTTAPSYPRARAAARPRQACIGLCRSAPCTPRPPGWWFPAARPLPLSTSGRLRQGLMGRRRGTWEESTAPARPMDMPSTLGRSPEARCRPTCRHNIMDNTVKGAGGRTRQRQQVNSLVAELLVGWGLCWSSSCLYCYKHVLPLFNSLQRICCCWNSNMLVG